jgi:ABC-type proline/glycine betaine transport system permease subunit
MSNILLEYIVPIGAIFAFSVACSITRKGFSTGTFLTACVIAISVLVWQDSLPTFSMIMVALIMVGMLFMDNSDGDDGDE